MVGEDVRKEIVRRHIMQDYQVLLDVVRQNFASVVWTHKIKEKQADIYAERYKLLETINVIVAAYAE